MWIKEKLSKETEASDDKPHGFHYKTEVPKRERILKEEERDQRIPGQESLGF